VACVIGIDLGTSSVRVVALNEAGEIACLRGAEYPIHQPAPGFAEQSPAQWWKAACECLRAVTDALRSASEQPCAVGMSGQMHGLVLLDSAGVPLRDAVIWPDGRTAGICAEWERAPGAGLIGGITGLPVATGFLAPSLAWVKRHEPEIYRRAERAVLPKDYIRFRLTGTLATDDSDASGTLLFDVTRRRWSEELAGSLGLDMRLLPPLAGTTSIAGVVGEKAAGETGLPPGIPVAVGGADQAMTAVALGINAPGVAAVAISSGGTAITSVERPFLDPRVHTLCHAEPTRWLLMGACLSAGLSLSWFARTFCAKTDGVYDALSREAEQVPPGSEGLLFAPYLNGDRTPHRDAAARGAFVGVTPRHTRAHFIRAIMEGVVFSLCETMDIFRELGLPIGRVISSGGGSRSALWRQIQADAFETPVEWRPGEEHSAIGAAIVAGAAVGRAIPLIAGGQDARVTMPNASAAEAYRALRPVFKEIYPRNASIFRDLTSIEARRAPEPFRR